jgi:hypothetical protein
MVMIPYKSAMRHELGSLHLPPKPLHGFGVDVAPHDPPVYLGISGYLHISSAIGGVVTHTIES